MEGRQTAYTGARQGKPSYGVFRVKSSTCPGKSQVLYPNGSKSTQKAMDEQCIHFLRSSQQKILHLTPFQNLILITAIY